MYNFASNKTLMPVNKDAMARYRIIDRMLADPNRNYTTQEIAREVGLVCPKVTLRMIQKDIHNIEDEFGQFKKKMVRNEGGRGTIRYEDQATPLFYQELTEDEEEMLREVLKSLGQFEGLSNFPWLEVLKRKVDCKPVSEQRHIISFGQNERLQIKDKALIGKLFKAISEKKVIRFKYRSFSEDKIVEETVHPYQIRQCNDRWYLLCSPEGNEKFAFDPEFVTNFALDRFIGGFEYVNEIPYVETPIDIEDRFREIIGITLYKDQEVEDIYFAVKPEYVKFIETKWVHSTQMPLDKESENYFISKYPSLKGRKFYSIECRYNHELDTLFSSYGDNVILVEPVDYRKRIQEIICSAADSYKNL